MLAVPQLTRSADIKLNQRVSLRRHLRALSPAVPDNFRERSAKDERLSELALPIGATKTETRHSANSKAHPCQA
jgi:hypothetical protein